MDKHALENYARLAQIRDTFFDVVQGVAMSVAFVPMTEIAVIMPMPLSHPTFTLRKSMPAPRTNRRTT